MLNELNFCDHVEQATGKVLGVHYCFIFGTFSPFGKEIHGISSMHMQEGWEAWKLDDNKNVEMLRVKELHSIEENLKIVIEWLQK